MGTLKYVLISTLCLSIFYAVFQLFMKNDSHFRFMRFYLLSSIMLSVIMPLNSLRIDTKLFNNQQQTEIPLVFEQSVVNAENYKVDKTEVKASDNAFSWETATSLFSKLYILISAFLFARVLFHISKTFIHFFKSEKQKQGKFIILYNKQVKTTFSFFNWVFVPSDNLQETDNEQIILHEKIHASQYHSIDLIVIELLAAVMWFNPVIWSFRKSMQLVHEYLADEGALSTGIDKLGYQALLINQVTEEKLICVSSNFNSQIKKRMIMITKSKHNRRTKLKILNLVPVSAILIIAIAIVNGLFASPIEASPKFHKEISNTNPVHDGYISDAEQYQDTIKKIKIQTKKKELNEKKSQEIKVIGYGKKPQDSSKVIYVVNGVQSYDIKEINPDSIASVNVLKDDNIIVIHTKAFQPKSQQIEVKNSQHGLSKTIIFVDGKEMPDNTKLNELDKNSIESINVLKSKESIKLFTDKECDGVILITTKK